MTKTRSNRFSRKRRRGGRKTVKRRGGRRRSRVTKRRGGRRRSRVRRGGSCMGTCKGPTGPLGADGANAGATGASCYHPECAKTSACGPSTQGCHSDCEPHCNTAQDTSTFKCSDPMCNGA